MKGRPGPKKELWKSWKVPEAKELHGIGPDILKTLPKEQPNEMKHFYP